MATPVEGYVLTCYGPEQYLHHAVASALSIRRHDANRPIALYCTEAHRKVLEGYGLDTLFAHVGFLPQVNRSVVGFKHNLHHFMPFDRNLFADSDMIWCRNPDPLWQQLSAFEFTSTGMERADFFFGAHKNLRVLVDILLGRRKRTLKRFGLTHLPRIQSGLMYGQSRAVVQKVCETAQEFMDKRHLTHFSSRLDEYGRSQESCEWSLAMAMSALKLQVFPWLQGYNSPQLDFIGPLTEYDPDFEQVTCHYPCDRFIYNLRGFPIEFIRKAMMGFFSMLPGRGDHLFVTPFALHFGWLHYKQPFCDFADRTWERLTQKENVPIEIN